MSGIRAGNICLDGHVMGNANVFVFTSRRLSHRLVSVKNKNKKKVTFAFWFIVASLFALLWIQILLARLACNFYLQFLLANFTCKFTCKFYLQIYLQIFVFQDFEKKIQKLWKYLIF